MFRSGVNDGPGRGPETPLRTHLEVPSGHFLVDPCRNLKRANSDVNGPNEPVSNVATTYGQTVRPFLRASQIIQELTSVMLAVRSEKIWNCGHPWNAKANRTRGAQPAAFTTA